jgi:nitrogenase subunit NifH
VDGVKSCPHPDRPNPALLTSAVLAIMKPQMSGRSSILQEYLSHIAMVALFTANPYYAMAKGFQPHAAIKDRITGECQNTKSIEDIRNLLQQYADTLIQALINTTEAILSCTNTLKSLCNNKLTLFDFSLTSNQKQL